MKKLSILLIALALVACVGVYATVAYFTDTAQVTNTFTVGKVNITLDEAVVDSYGTASDPKNRTSTGNTYHLVPGHSYVKDPTITVVSGSECSHIRMQVTINHLYELQSILDNDLTTQMPFVGTIGDGWEYHGCYTDATASTRTYEYRYSTTVDARTADQKLPALFPSFTVPGELTAEQLNQLTVSPDFEMKIIGHAIQADGFNDASEAWTAFGTQNSVTPGTSFAPAPTASTEPNTQTANGSDEPGVVVPSDAAATSTPAPQEAA